MPFAMTLCLDAAGAARIRGLWQVVAVAGFGDALALGYRPHITLGVWSDSTDPAALQAAAERASEPLEAVFAALAAFPGDPAVLFAAPVVTLALLQRHAAVLDGLPVPLPHYRPAAWVPHATLSDSVPAAATGRALQSAAAAWAPFRCRLDRIELVRFRPVELLWGRDLA